MSHYSLMVILKENEEITEGILNEKLEPFYEGLETEERTEECYCKGSLAYRESLEKTESILGTTLNELKREFNEKKPDVSWEEFISEYKNTIDSLIEIHPYKGKPDPNCEDCEGGGIVLTNYNLNSKWDWWEIGGRFENSILTKTGELVDYARVKEIDFEKLLEMNKEKLKKAWEEAQGKSEVEKKFMYGINENMTYEEYISNVNSITTFAVLSQDGNWYERGEMGWFATVHNETESQEDWSNKFFERFILNLKPNDQIVIIDCHI